MLYFENRSKDIKKLHAIFNTQTPSIIRELVSAPQVFRLNNVSQACGVDLTSFKLFNYKYSRLDHSVGVALILDNFITDKNQIIAGLLHDISSPAFAHSIDFMNRDYVVQESTEYSTYDQIIGSDELFEYFLKNEISINDICDYSKYPLADSEKPKLCADRLEYLLHAAYFTNLCDIDEIKELYSDLCIMPNEENKPEFAFNTPELGKKFCRLSIELGRKYRSYEAKISMQFIADLVRLMIKRGEIEEKDLYEFGDKAIMQMGIDSSDVKVSNGWKYLQKMNKVYTKFNEVTDKYCRRVITKQRYVDPLVKISGGIVRTSKYYKDSEREIEAFLNSDTDLYMYIDYQL